jgi:hypothetical protein
MIDENLPHNAGTHGEKVGAAFPAGVIPVD